MDRKTARSGNTNSSFAVISFASVKYNLIHSRRHLHHRSIISHGDHQGIFGNTQFFEFVHDLADKDVDITLEAVHQHTS